MIADRAGDAGQAGRNRNGLARLFPKRSLSGLLLFCLCALGYAFLYAVTPQRSPLFMGAGLRVAHRVLVPCLFLLAAAMLLVERARTFRCILLTHFLLSWLYFGVFEQPFEAVLIITIVNLIPVALYERYPLSLVFCSGFVLLTAAALTIQGAPSPGRVASFALVAVALGSSCSLMSRYREGMVALQRYVNQLLDNVESLTRANSLSQDYARGVEEESRTAERLQLTRDIHDAVGYTLTNSIMMMEAVKLMARTEPGRVAEYIDTIRRNTEDGLLEIRRILRDLRAKDESRETVYWAVRKLVKVFSLSTGCHVCFEFGNTRWEDLDAYADCVYHFIQEGLINAFRHGRANRIVIFSWDHGREIRLRIEDDGVGTEDEPEEHIGIAGMRERAAAVGGRIAIDGSSRGFSISLYLPGKVRDV